MDIFSILHITLYAIIVLVLSGVLFFRWWNRRKAIIVNIIRDFGEQKKIIKRAHVDPKKESYTFDDKLYVLDLKYAILDGLNRPVLYFGYNDAIPISIHEDKRQYSPNLLKAFIQNRVYPQLLGNSVDNIMLILIAIIIIVVISFGAYSAYQNQGLKTLIVEMIKELNKAATVITQ